MASMPERERLVSGLTLISTQVKEKEKEREREREGGS